MRKLLGIILFLVFAITLTTVLFLYGRGYRPNFDDKNIESTGVLTIKSVPSDARVFINDEEKGKTDIDIANLSPGKYVLKITKDGFSTWGKEITIKKEQVNRVEVVLFPKAPNISSLTFTGVGNALVSPNRDKIVFSVKEKGNAGIWALNLSTQTIPVFFSKDNYQVVADSDKIEFSEGQMQFSQDGSDLLVSVGSKNPRYYLLNPTEKNENPKSLTSTQVKELKRDWEKQRKDDFNKQIKNLGERAEKFAAKLGGIKFSPDGKRFFGTDAKGDFYVFDSEPNLAADTKPQTHKLRPAKKYAWYPDSKHLIALEEDQISVVDIDGKNKTSVYTGKFDSNLVVPWADGSKLVITTRLNSGKNKLPNLYAIELR
jgi:Tol biopolymer transport system component